MVSEKLQRHVTKWILDPKGVGCEYKGGQPCLFIVFALFKDLGIELPDLLRAVDNKVSISAGLFAYDGLFRIIDPVYQLPKLGDVPIFYSNEDNGGFNVHVGFVLGRNEFVHAVESMDVRRGKVEWLITRERTVFTRYVGPNRELLSQG